MNFCVLAGWDRPPQLGLSRSPVWWPCTRACYNFRSFEDSKVSFIYVGANADGQGTQATLLVVLGWGSLSLRIKLRHPKCKHELYHTPSPQKLALSSLILGSNIGDKHFCLIWGCTWQCIGTYSSVLCYVQGVILQCQQSNLS